MSLLKVILSRRRSRAVSISESWAVSRYIPHSASWVLTRPLHLSQLRIGLTLQSLGLGRPGMGTRPVHPAWPVPPRVSPSQAAGASAAWAGRPADDPLHDHPGRHGADLERAAGQRLQAVAKQRGQLLWPFESRVTPDLPIGHASARASIGPSPVQTSCDLQKRAVAARLCGLL